MLSELWSELRYRLRAIARRGSVERELDDEVRFHLEREIEKHVQRGVPPADARRLAAVSFGGVTRIKDDTRDARGIGLWERGAQDARYALRGLRARPLFAAAVITTLALGVGVNAAMFGVLDRLLFRPPAFLRDPGGVNRVYLAWTTHRGRGWLRTADYAWFADFARWSRSVSEIAAFCNLKVAVGSGEDVNEENVAVVSARLFDFFDAHPTAGRFFSAEEDEPPTGKPVAVLAYDYWQTRYGGRRDVLGRSIAIGRVTYTIIGVAPRGFDGVSDQRPPVVFIPVTAYAASIDAHFDTSYGWEWLDLLVRRRPGISVDGASIDLTNAFRRGWTAQAMVEATLPPLEFAKPTVLAGPLQLGRGPLAGNEARVVVWIGGVAFIVLLVACANVGNLLLARALRRRREIAVRLALGGTRVRLIQQLFTETLILALLGDAAGLVAAQCVSAVLGRLLLGAAGAFNVVTDVRTLAFASLLGVAITVVAGTVPALHQGTSDLAGSLKAGVREGAYRQSRTRTALLVTQAALSVALLIGAGLFARSLQQVQSLRLGYDVNPILYVRTKERGTKLSNLERTELAARLLDAARSLPGVVSATRVVSVPFGNGEIRPLSVPGLDSVRRYGRFLLQAGSPDYFATIGTRIVRGRALTSADRAGTAPVIVVSDAMAREFWGLQDPIGKCVRVGGDTMPCRSVVGVAENIKATDLSGDSGLTYYLPIEQRAALFGAEAPALLVRVAGRADDYAERVRAALQPLLPGAYYVITTPMHEKLDPSMRAWKFGAALFLAFGALALTLAAVGLYAVIAFSVAQRAHELGVRIAVGARTRDILRLIIGEGIVFTVAGIAIGVAIALASGHWVQPLLFDVSSFDPLTYGVVAFVLLAVGVLASALPAVRAARVDPTVALRVD
jgi:putative ABC transport system permease protein